MLCSICLGTVGRKRYKTCCNHHFHSKCLLRWILVNDTCPMCRTMLRARPTEEEEDIDVVIDEEDITRFRSLFFIILDIISTRY